MYFLEIKFVRNLLKNGQIFGCVHRNISTLHINLHYSFKIVFTVFNVHVKYVDDCIR